MGRTSKLQLCKIACPDSFADWLTRRGKGLITQRKKTGSGIYVVKWRYRTSKKKWTLAQRTALAKVKRGKRAPTREEKGGDTKGCAGQKKKPTGHLFGKGVSDHQS